MNFQIVRIPFNAKNSRLTGRVALIEDQKNVSGFVVSFFKTFEDVLLLHLRMKLIHPNKGMENSIQVFFFEEPSHRFAGVLNMQQLGEAATGVSHLHRSLDFAKTHFEGAGHFWPFGPFG